MRTYWFVRSVFELYVNEISSKYILISPIEAKISLLFFRPCYYESITMKTDDDCIWSRVSEKAFKNVVLLCKMDGTI